MSEVSDITIKRTQDTLGKIIKKPALTEKLLRKPPFKFLHDIINAVIKTTGFLDGLYTEDELQSENIKDRDLKIAFLQKTIDTLKLATKQEVKARPSKIVAGLEADKTNELLIAIAKAIDRKIDSTEAVELVKSGNVNVATKKDSKTVKTQAKKEPRKAKKETNEPTVTKKVKSTVGSDPSKIGKKSESNAKLNKENSKDSTDSKKAKTGTLSLQNKEKNKKKDHEKSSVQNEERANEKVANSDPMENAIETPVANGFTQNDMTKQSKPNIAKSESVDKSLEQSDMPKNEPGTPVSQEVTEKREQGETSENSAKTPKVKKIVEKHLDEKSEEEKVLKETSKVPAPLENGTFGKSEESVREPSAHGKVEKPSSDKPRSSKQRRNHTKHDQEKSTENAKSEEKITNSKSVDKLIERQLATVSKTIESNKQSKPRTALRSSAIRPISARPSAPRRRDRNVRQIIHTESFVHETNDSNKVDKKNSIPEFDDADNIVITETITDNISAIDEPIANYTESEMNGKQGHLVQQILETQTAILKSDAKNDVSAISDESILNDRKSITRNMTELRKMIQKLSLYITPLGKMMEYFQEDVDAMQIELLMWQKAGTAAETDIKEEQRATEKILESFKYNLAEINNSIKEHAEQINNTTMNIIQNEEKISKLISTL